MSTGQPSVLVNQDGHLEAFERRWDGVIVHSWQDVWGQWPVLADGHRMQSAPSVLLNADGRAEAFTTGADGDVHHTWQPAWPGWARLTTLPRGITFGGQPVAVANRDGHFEVFARASDRSYWHSWRLADYSWSAWNPLAGRFDSDPAVIQNQDGHLEVFGLALDGTIQHSWFAGGGVGWVPFRAFPPWLFKSRPAVVRNGDGRLELFAIGSSDGQMGHIYQTVANGGWSNWSGTSGAPFGGWTGDPAVVNNPDGRPEVFARGTDNGLWHAWQYSWNWSPLGGQLISSPVAVREQSPYISVWYQGTTALLYESYRGPDGGWSPHQSRGGPTPPDRLQLSVPYFAQIHSLSCEAAATQMALAWEGINPGQDPILNAMNPSRRAAWHDSNGMRWDDPYVRFVGSPDGSELNDTGYGTYWPVVAAVAQSYGGHPVEAGEGITPDDIYWAARNSHPSVVWVAYHGGNNDYSNYQPLTPRSYLADDGRWVLYGRGYEHSVTVIGVSPDSVLINNPWRTVGQVWLPKSVFESSFNAFNHMAVTFD